MDTHVYTYLYIQAGIYIFVHACVIVYLHINVHKKVYVCILTTYIEALIVKAITSKNIHNLTHAETAGNVYCYCYC